MWKYLIASDPLKSITTQPFTLTQKQRSSLFDGRSATQEIIRYEPADDSVESSDLSPLQVALAIGGTDLGHESLISLFN
jgi:hypothetical protein